MIVQVVGHLDLLQEYMKKFIDCMYPSDIPLKFTNYYGREISSGVNQSEIFRVIIYMIKRDL